jgi:hypothetical protein
MRIANFYIKNQTDESNPSDPAAPSSGLVSNFLMNNTQSSTAPLVISSGGIWNDHEPASSDEEPSPAFANYYKSDDFVYHRLAGKWKRTTLKTFQQNP